MSEAIENELTPEELYDQEYEKAFFGEEEVEEEETVNEEETQEVSGESETDEVSEDKADDETNDEVVEEETPKDDEQPETDSRRTLKWNKKEVEVSEEERDALAQQAFDYTYKTQQLSKERKSFESELELLNKAKSGDKEALATLMKDAGVDPLDLMDVNTEQGDAKPSEPFVSPQVSALMQEVEKDAELYGAMQQIELELPDSVVGAMAQDAETFYTVVNEVKSGDVGIVLPRLNAKIATLSPMDRQVVMTDPRAYAQLYGNVKQSLMAEAQPQAEQPKPTETRTKPNYNEVSVPTQGKSRGGESKADSLSSDDAYYKILERLNNQ